ncbi:MAG: hypothetical protein SCK28_05040 [Bacillota bacterium]|nr:hypothetical protein [Bacillota bacterium]
MDCFYCGNCKINEAMYYCTAKNEFVIPNETKVVEKSKTQTNWKKGSSQYEDRRRRIKQTEIKSIG